MTVCWLRYRKFPNLSVQFTYKKVYFADGSLVIEDVVAEGHLLGAEWKVCIFFMYFFLVEIVASRVLAEVLPY